jgi:hypothetical protein
VALCRFRVRPAQPADHDSSCAIIVMKSECLALIVFCVQDGKSIPLMFLHPKSH